MSDETLARASAGDDRAFAELTDPYRSELRAHCYRIVGSVADADDLLQETLLAAWRALDRFEGRGSIRAWLYRIATNRCLNAMRDSRRRPRADQPGSGTSMELPEPSGLVEPVWVEPFPDILFDDLPDDAPGPEARYERKEAFELAFLVALQQLPPQQRAVLLLRDVLGFRAGEVADMLDRTEDSVTSALARARHSLAGRLPKRGGDRGDGAGAAAGRELAGRFASAFERGDVPAIIAMLTEDARLTMPPLPLEYRGQAAIARFLSTVSFRAGQRTRLVPTRANSQPAFGCYVRDTWTSIARPHGLLVLTLDADRIAGLTRFVDNSVLPRFGLPRTLTD